MNSDDVRAVSRNLFGNRYKLEVAALISKHCDQTEQVVYARQLAQSLSGPADNQVRQVFLQFAASGLLLPIDEKVETRARRHRVRMSRFWDSSRLLLDELQRADWSPSE